VRARIEQVFNDDLALLGSWLGIELTCKNFRELTRELIPQWTDQAQERAA
jgi:hypothetical protein